MGSNTKGNVEVTRFKWQINVDCLDGKLVGDKIISPKFLSNIHTGKGETKWYLKLYPQGVSQECEGFLSIFLYNCTHTYHKCNATYSLSLLNQDNVKVDYSNVMSHLFEPNGSGYGCPKFIKKSFIVDPTNSIFKDNKLIILCKIKVNNNIEVDNQHSEKSSPVENHDSLEKLFTSQDFSDVTVIAKNKSLKLHKCILSTRSTVFEAMFKNDMKEKKQNTVEIKDIRYKVLLELFRFMYTGRVNHIESIVSELLTAAEKYDMESLKALCEKTMSRILNEINAIEYLNSAILNNADKLKVDAIEWIAFNLEFFIRKPDFLSLDKEVLIKIMERTINM